MMSFGGWGFRASAGFWVYGLEAIDRKSPDKYMFSPDNRGVVIR
jgi:hypothetical protein